jgi:bifunctional N-acetylglucosamine-1-phosphate-uridyltransferase/glucosamine-1-phosphate-acetyltransferase GlmU-like protein
MFRPEDFFELKLFEHRALFEGVEYVWEVLKRIKPYIQERITPNLSGLKGEGVMLTKTCVLFQGNIMKGDFDIRDGDATKRELLVFQGEDELKGASVLYAGSFFFHNGISIGQGSVVEPGALVRGPAIIGSNTEIRQGAYIRGNCIVGDRCVVGHTTEMKNAVMFNDAKAGHFAYIGDSVLGNNVNLGAGTKCANLKMTGSDVVVRAKRKAYRTGLKKFGAILGDNVETGCNSVTSPGVLLGKSSLVYPNVNVPSGYHPYRSIMSGKKTRR